MAPPVGPAVPVHVEGTLPETPLSLAVLWLDEGSVPPFELVSLGPIPGADFPLPLPAGPPARMLEASDTPLRVIGYLLAYEDLDGDGNLTPVAAKVRRWPEVRGSAIGHVLLFTEAPIRPGGRPALVRDLDLPAGTHLMGVDLVARCEGDACDGYDRFLPSAPLPVVLTVPESTATMRMPNLD